MWIDRLKRPEAYAPMAIPFWDDDYISQQMLAAHLDPEFEGASRPHAFLDRSAAWIAEVAPAAEFPQLLDIGCGPGLYAERFAEQGFAVTGVDFSRRSVAYAREQAAGSGSHCRFVHQNYLELKLGEQYDLCTLIYCDFGVLSPAQRRRVLENVGNHLRPGGRFLLDAFSMHYYEAFQEKQTWESCPQGGFWRPDAYAVLEGSYRYDDGVLLDMDVVASKARTDVYYLWNTCFSPESLAREAEAASFRVAGLYGDVAGAPFTQESDTLAVWLEK